VPTPSPSGSSGSDTTERERRESAAQGEIADSGIDDPRAFFIGGALIRVVAGLARAQSVSSSGRHQSRSPAAARPWRPRQHFLRSSRQRQRRYLWQRQRQLLRHRAALQLDLGPAQLPWSMVDVAAAQLARAVRGEQAVALGQEGWRSEPCAGPANGAFTRQRAAKRRCPVRHDACARCGSAIRHRAARSACGQGSTAAGTTRARRTTAAGCQVEG